MLEKINDNGYKLDLPTNFGVSPTFNVADLRPYFGEEDELESRTTQMQERGNDEDINTIDTSLPTPTPLGPITRARARQLKHQVSSFLSSYSCLDNGDACTLVVLRNDGVDNKETSIARAGFRLQDSSNF